MKKVLTLLLALALAIGLMVPAAVMAASVTPDLWDPWTSGDAASECERISSGADFAYKVEPWDEGDPSGTYTDEVSGNTITIKAYADEGEYKTFDWESEFPVVAVIVKAGTKAYVYWYHGAYSDTGLYAPDGKAISHATFCFDEPVVTQATLSVIKFYDTNANGVADEGEPLLEPEAYAPWKFTINGDLYETPISTTLDPETYVIVELRPIETCWMATTATTVTIELEAGDSETAYFGNVCLGSGGGLTPGFWSNKNGQALFGADDLALMVSLNLRDANGYNFDPAAYAAFKTWLLDAKATNMAYMLSAQLAAMELNVFNGKVNGGALVYAPELLPFASITGLNSLGFISVNDLMAAANTELGLHGSTLAGSPYRPYQEALKSALDNANNNKTFVQPTPCPYSFP